jgi:hypothetical protein
VVTGDLERKSLRPCLKQCFPAHDLDGRAVEWLEPRKVPGVTTYRLRAGAAPSKPMLTLARAVLSEALIGSDGVPADLVLAVDDLELHNVDQCDVIAQHFVAAVGVELPRLLAGRLEGEREDAAARVRERCSFHLLSPMVEAYLFGEPAALVRAGCAPSDKALVRSTDWEDFWSVDPRFVSDCRSVNARMAAPRLANVWWQEERHAKHYLESLVQRGGGGWYEETVGGSRAFESLDWGRVLRGPTECTLVRALFADLADFFGVHAPGQPGVPSSVTWRRGGRRGGARVLRNL